jgi:hypothetical protein
MVPVRGTAVAVVEDAVRDTGLNDGPPIGNAIVDGTTGMTRRVK